MAIQYFQPMLNKFMGTALRYAISGGSTSQDTSITLMKGTQPSAASIIASWSSYNTSVLVHWDGVKFLLPPDSLTITSQKSTTTSTPTARTAVGTGVAEWAIIWTRDNTGFGVAQSAVLNTSLPRSQFLIVPASGPTGNGVVKVSTANIVTGTSYAPTDITIRMGIS
jgi:hypothetical protein